MPDKGKQLAALAADLRLDLGQLRRGLQEMSRYRDQLSDDPDVPQRLAIAGMLHSIYNGIEVAFRRVARTFENDLDSASWHAHLLRRMACEVPGIRPQLITPEIGRTLDVLRRFRHMFRNIYFFELNWEEMQPAYKAVVRVWPELEACVQRFMDTIETEAREASE